MVNRAGVSYDAARTKDIYAEDFNKDRDEIVAIENELGANPKGAYDDVSARLTAITALLGLKSKIITSTRDMTAANGDVAYSGVGFQPSAVIALCTINGSWPFSVGFADSAGAEMAIANSDNADMMYGRTALCWLQTGSGVAQSAVLKQYDSDGFTLTWAKNGSPTGTGQLYFLCLR